MTGYMGCIGADDFGERLASECKSAGVAARPTVMPDLLIAVILAADNPEMKGS